MNIQKQMGKKYPKKTPVPPKVAISWTDVSTHFEGSVNYLNTGDVFFKQRIFAATKKCPKDQPEAQNESSQIIFE